LSTRLRPCWYGLLVGAVLVFSVRPGVGAETSSAPALSTAEEQAAAKTFRPVLSDDQGETLTIEDLNIQRLVSEGALKILTTAIDVKTEEGEAATYGDVVIRNCEIGAIRADAMGSNAEGQIAAIRISGGGAAHAGETDVLIEDVYIHDGPGGPIRIEEGDFGTITFRRVRIERMAKPAVVVSFVNSGSVGRIRIEDSPGLVVRLVGRPGSVGEVVRSGSPDARVVDELSPKRVKDSEVVANAGEVKGAAEPVKLSVPAAAASPNAAAPGIAAPKPEPVAPAKPIEMTAVGEGDSIRISVANVPKEISHITFAVFNRLDYRIGVPVILTEAPWEATIKVGKAGMYTARVTVTRAGGDTDRPIEKRVELR
jgi:hypothetical protein